MATYTDTFTEAATVALSAHTASPSAGTWTQIENTTGGTGCIVHENDHASAATTVASSRAACTVDWAPASADYSVSAICVAFNGTDDGMSLLARVVDSENYYALTCTGAQMTIVEKLAGTFTNIATTVITMVANDVVKFELIGSTLKGYQNDVEMVSVSNSSFGSAGSVGLGFGNIHATASFDHNASTDWDDFTLVDIESSGRTTHNTTSHPHGIARGTRLGIGGGV